MRWITEISPGNHPYRTSVRPPSVVLSRWLLFARRITEVLGLDVPIESRIGRRIRGGHWERVYDPIFEGWWIQVETCAYADPNHPGVSMLCVECEDHDDVDNL